MPRKNLFIAHKSYIKQHCTVIRNLWYVISTETIIYGVRNSSIYNFYILSSSYKRINLNILVLNVFMYIHSDVHPDQWKFELTYIDKMY